MRQILIPYPQYKETNDLWINKVPSHWTLTRQKNIVKMLVSNVDKHTNEGEIPVRLCNYIDVYKNDRIAASLKFMQASAKPDEIEQFRLRPDDLLITKDSESWIDIGVPALVEYTADDLICGYHLAILRSKKEKISGGYLNRLHQCQNVKIQYHVNANGVTRYGLSHGSIENIVLSLPPIEEQNAIVRFLDYTDRRIKRYVRAKQKLIKLLEEEKQAIIHQAVTRGLNPDVPLKSSGVEWMGNIPTNWNIIPSKRVLSIRSGEYLNSSKFSLEISAETPYPVIGGNGVMGFTDVYNTSPISIVVGRVGALCGNIHMIDELSWVTDNALRIETFKRIDPLFLSHQLQIINLNKLANKNAQPLITGSMVKSQFLLIPPIEEQIKIVNFINNKATKINNLIENIFQQNSLFQEYRTRLIADVVTGKLDVRAVAAQLPEDLEEEEIDLEEVEPEEDDELEEALEP